MELNLILLISMIDIYSTVTLLLGFANDCSITPLTDYANNDVYKELPKQKGFFETSYEKLFIDLRKSKGYTGELEMLLRDDSDLTLTITLKQAATTTKIKLRVTGYYQGKYMCTLSRGGLIIKSIAYSKIRTF